MSVEFVDPAGKRLDEGSAVTNRLAPGQEATEKAQGLTQVTGPVRCRVTEVTRWASR